MAQYLSPGVYWSEVDLTTVVPNVSVSVGAYVGDFEWGPLNEIINVGNEDELVNLFHKPTNTNFTDFFTAANFLSYARTLKLVRVANDDELVGAKNATAAGVGVLIRNNDHFERDLSKFTSSSDYGMWAARYPGFLGNSIKVSVFAASGNQLAFDSWEYKNQFSNKLPGTTRHVEKEGGKNDEVHVIIVDEKGYFTGTRGTILEKYTSLSKATDALTEDGSSNYWLDVINRASNYVYVLHNPGTDLYRLANVNITSGGSGLFSANNIAVTGGYGKDAVVNVVCDGNGVITRVDVANTGSGYHENDVLHISVPEGSGAQLYTIVYEEPDPDNTAPVYNVTSFTIVSGGSGYANATELVIGGGSGSGLLANISVNAIGAIVHANVYQGGTDYSNNELVSAVTANTFFPHILSAQLAKSGEVESTWGRPGINQTFNQSQEKYTSSLSGGVSIRPRESDITRGYDLFADSDTVDVSLIMTGAHATDISEYIIHTVIGGSDARPTGRRDAVVFLSPPVDLVGIQSRANIEDIVNWKNGYNNDQDGDGFNAPSSYAVIDSCWKKQFDKYNNVNRWVPMNADIAGLCARTDFEKDSWWSPAGFNRGQIKNALAVSWNPTLSERDSLYSNGINPVVNFRGEGVILYGDKTSTAKPSAFDRINVRRLFITLEKAITRAAKYSLFEFNDQFTRAQFVALIEPYLRDIKGRRGIYDYRVVCDESNNTPEVIDRNEFRGDIYIKPARSINFIQLNFVAVRTGVDFSTVVGKFG